MATATSDGLTAPGPPLTRSAPGIDAPANGTPSPEGAAAAAEPSLSPTGESVSRREQVVDAAAEMFAQYGYNDASLRNIARHAHMSHSGMLHHFASKDALLAAVIDRLEGHAQDALDRTEEFCVDPDALIEALGRVWNPASGPIQLLARLDAEIVSPRHPARFRMARLRRVHEHVLERCFTELAERGLLRAGADPQFAARALLALVLAHAVRERTVRCLQRTTHDDCPPMTWAHSCERCSHLPACPGTTNAPSKKGRAHTRSPNM